MSHQKEAAQTLGALGFRVHPLHTPIFTDDGITRCSCGRSECYVRADGTGGEYAASVGKHPRLKDWWAKASASAGQIDQWWTEYPDANIGIACGLPDGMNLGVVVIDVDPRNGGTETLERLVEELGPLPQTAQAISGGGGPHFYFLTTEPIPSGKLGPGVDFQARGNQVVAPPSLHKSGRRYAWELSSDPTDGAQIAMLPDAWATCVLASKERAVRVDASEPGAPIVEGNGGKDGPGRKQTLISRGRVMLAKSFSPSEIRAALAAMNDERCVPPLDERDFERVVEFVLRKPAGPSKEFAATEASEATPANDDALESDVSARYSDALRAERFAGSYREEFRYCAAMGWLAYERGRYRVDDLCVLVAAKEASKQIARDVLDDPDLLERQGVLSKKGQKILSSVLSKNAITAVETLARGDLAVNIAQLDSDKMLFNCANGTIDLRTGELREHRYSDLITKQSPVVYDPHAQAPTWRAFLERVLPDAGVREFVQRFIGYSLTGLVREHVFPIFYGPGGNGKGVLLGAIADVMSDYARTVAPEMLMQREKEEHKTEIAYLLGARLAVAQETKQGNRLDENKVKSLTGGDRLNARFMRGDFFDFDATHKVVLATNHKPLIRGTDEGIWRRIALVPWSVVIPKEQQDTRLKEKLRAEAPGILQWCIEGCAMWQRDGLVIPPAIQATTQAYRGDSDVIGRFLEERTTRLPSLKVQSSKLHEEFKRWCSVQGEKDCSGKAFTTELCEKHGIALPRKSNGTMWLHGIGLLAPSIREDGDDGESSQVRDNTHTHKQLTEEPSPSSLSSPGRVRGVA